MESSGKSSGRYVGHFFFDAEMMLLTWVLNTYFSVTERIIHLCCCRRSRPGRAGSTGPSCSRPGSDEPWQSCYRLGIVILSHVRNQTSRGTLSEYSRHVVRSEGYNQASCRVCARFIQSRCSLILGQNKQYKMNPPYFSFLDRWLHCCMLVKDNVFLLELWNLKQH